MNGLLQPLGAWVDPAMIPVIKFFAAAAAAATRFVSGICSATVLCFLKVVPPSTKSFGNV